MLRWTRIVTMILHHSSRMEYQQAKSKAFCILWCCILYRLYAITMHRRHEKKYENERIEKIWALFEYLNDRSASRSENQTSQPATVSTSATIVSVRLCLCICSVHTVNAPCIIIWKTKCWITKAAQTASIYYNNNINSICSNRKFSWISEFVEWKLFMLNTNLFKSIVY